MNDIIIDKVHVFIENHIDEIDRNEFEKLYGLLDNPDDIHIGQILYHNVGIFTDILLEAGIDPLINSNKVYENMFVSSSQKSIILPDRINTLGRSAFYGAHNLESIIIPEGVTKIPFECFQQCYNMDWILIPKSVQIIDPEAFTYDHIFLVKCYKGSYADRWADEQGLNTEYLE